MIMYCLVIEIFKLPHLVQQPYLDLILVSTISQSLLFSTLS